MFFFSMKNSKCYCKRLQNNSETFFEILEKSPKSCNSALSSCKLMDSFFFLSFIAKNESFEIFDICLESVFLSGQILEIQLNC